MGTLRTRTVGGTVLLALLLVLAGCSGGGAEQTPGVTATTTEGNTTGTPMATATAAEDGTDDGGAGTGPVDRQYLFNDSEGYGYLADLPNGTTKMSWVVTSTDDGDPRPYTDVTVDVGFGRFGTNVTTVQGGIFEAVISDGSVGGPFYYVRTPVVLAAGHDLRVGNEWTVRGENVTVGDDFSVGWSEATVEITGQATVAGETCYELAVRTDGNATGPRSCIKHDWPFALAVDTPDRDFQLAEFERP
jgi:hypothetical protein